MWRLLGRRRAVAVAKCGERNAQSAGLVRIWKNFSSGLIKINTGEHRSPCSSTSIFTTLCPPECHLQPEYYRTPSNAPPVAPSQTLIAFCAGRTTSSTPPPACLKTTSKMSTSPKGLKHLGQTSVRNITVQTMYKLALDHDQRRQTD